MYYYYDDPYDPGASYGGPDGEGLPSGSGGSGSDSGSEGKPWYSYFLDLVGVLAAGVSYRGDDGDGWNYRYQGSSDPSYEAGFGGQVEAFIPVLIIAGIFLLVYKKI